MHTLLANGQAGAAIPSRSTARLTAHRTHTIERCPRVGSPDPAHSSIGDTLTPRELPQHEGMATGREQALVDWLRARGSVLIGYSGGVDSAYLAAVALDTLGAERTIAVIGRSASYPEAQWAAARRIADQIGLPVREVATDEMSDPRYAANPSNRCYFCKTELWSRLIPLARELGIDTVVDGTNADDVQGHRPGMLAAREWGVASPLAEVGLRKADIRERSAVRGLPTWDQPSSPCLSSRLPTGIAVTPLRLARVEAAEQAVRALGVRGDLRVRYHGDTARVEMTAEELDAWRVSGRRGVLRDAVVGAGFARVELDLRGFRSGMTDQPVDPDSLDVLEA